jgi:hypothetical protein
MSLVHVLPVPETLFPLLFTWLIPFRSSIFQLINYFLSETLISYPHINWFSPFLGLSLLLQYSLSNYAFNYGLTGLMFFSSTSAEGS